MFKDNKFGDIFPTRTGTPTGASNERKMLDAIGGSDSFRTRLQTNIDGSVTMLRTKNGMPQFSTTGNKGSLESYIYMESGQLSVPLVRGDEGVDPGKWFLLDLLPDQDYLGKIITSSPGVGKQKPGQNIHDGQDSLAIGYPRSTDEATDTQNKLAYTSFNTRKALAAAYFPPALFTGKMRLFLQAQYGGPANKDCATGVFVDAVGESVALRYMGEGTNKISNEKELKSITFGLWSHSSPGLFTAPDDTWWVLVVGLGNNQVGLTAYPLILSSEAEVLRKSYIAGKAKGGFSTDEVEKIEAYILANSTVDTVNFKSAETDVDARGDALMYGWKFNKNGDKASVVAHELLEDASGNDRRWLSNTVHLTITYSSGIFSAAASVEVGGEWTDGWGGYNIFRPVSDISAVLECVSLAMANGCRAPFSFSAVPVYGYYKDDAWCPVTLSRTVHPPGINYEHEYSNLEFGTAYDLSALLQGPVPLYEYGSVMANRSAECSLHAVTEHTEMGISFDGFAYNGSLKGGMYTHWKWNYLGDIAPQSPGWKNEPVETSMPYAGDVVPGQCEGQAEYVALFGVYETDENGVKHYALPNDISHGEILRSNYRSEFWEGPLYKFNTWTLVIPGYDAEALYIGTKEAESTTDNIMVHIATGPHRSGSNFYSWLPIGIAEPRLAGRTYAWFVGPQLISESTLEQPWSEPEHRYAMKCFNNAIVGVAASANHSYYGLFVVDKNYPYYDPGMWFCTSYGKRYFSSEGPCSPASVKTTRTFVGWA